MILTECLIISVNSVMRNSTSKKIPCQKDNWRGFFVDAASKENYPCRNLTTATKNFYGGAAHVAAKNFSRKVVGFANRCFLTNNSAAKYQTRIDLILDLMAGKKFDDKDKYATFFYFDDLKRRGNDLNELWQEIVRNFLLLKDWRENHDFYHKIGYLIASGYKTLAKIYAASKGKSKREFYARLNEFIKDSVKLSGGKNYSDRNYNGDAEKIRRLLLLFNVESVRQNGEQSQWFPFDKYKFGGEKSSWSLEHIHAVTAQDKGT